MVWQKFILAVGAFISLAAWGQVTTKNIFVLPLSLSSEGKAMPMQSAGTLRQKGCFDNSCHANIKPDKPTSEHLPFAKGECELCHSADPHHQPINRTPNTEIALCTSCHSLESLGNSHPLGNGVIDPNSGIALSCVTCHSPHYSNHSDQLILDGRGELCVHCHKKFLNKDY